MSTEQKEISLVGLKVCIAIPNYSGIIPIDLMLSMIKLQKDLINYGVALDILIERENALIAATRDILAERFLHESTADYMFWLDDDILFTSEDFLNILSLTTKFHVTAATYPVRQDEPLFFIRYITEGTPEFESEYGLLKAKGCGLGFTCISREVMAKLWKKGKKYKNNKRNVKLSNIFKVGVVNNRYYGEDMWFFEDLYNLGYPVYIHPLINLKHVGRKDYDHKLMNYVTKNITKDTNDPSIKTVNKDNMEDK